VPIADPRYITGRFNSHLVKCLLLHCDEGFWAGDKAAEGKLKDLITGPRTSGRRSGRGCACGRFALKARAARPARGRQYQTGKLDGPAADSAFAQIVAKRRSALEERALDLGECGILAAVTGRRRRERLLGEDVAPRKRQAGRGHCPGREEFPAGRKAIVHRHLH
jgi:hypothetical protein